jgi:hypothetical protein
LSRLSLPAIRSDTQSSATITVNDLAFAAQRAAQSRPDLPVDQTEARFRSLVQSPLRAGLVRFLNARPGESTSSR